MTQSISGTGALRIGGAFLGRFYPHNKTIYLPVPSWGNHTPVFRDSGLEVKGLRVTVTDTIPTTPQQDEGEAALVVHLVGHDHPGIIHKVTATMARLGVTIDDLSTGLREAPMGDGILFEAQVQCRITNATTLDDLRSELEAIATEIMVDIDLVDRS